MITDIEAYFTLGCGRCARHATPDCSTRAWASGLTALRRICREAGLLETVKWAHPCYMHSGRNICVIGALRGDFRLSFFNAALMKDPEGILEKQGQNTQYPDMIRFTDTAQPAAMATVITTYLKEAMGYAEAGITPPRNTRAVDLPDALLEALSADPELAGAFHALTPGRQKSWAIHIGAAKKPETRLARIAKGRDKIFAGKGAMDR